MFSYAVIVRSNPHCLQDLSWIQFFIYSDNDNSTNATVTKSIPVQFAVDLTAKAYVHVFTLTIFLLNTLLNHSGITIQVGFHFRNYEYSNTYFIVNQEDKGLKNLVNVYEVWHKFYLTKSTLDQFFACSICFVFFLKVFLLMLNQEVFWIRL